MFLSLVPGVQCLPPSAQPNVCYDQQARNARCANSPRGMMTEAWRRWTLCMAGARTKVTSW